MERAKAWLVRSGGVLLAVSAALSVTVPFWFGYRAIQEWRLSSLTLAERRSSEAADLMAVALHRDMRGVQESVLGSQQWHGFARRESFEMSSLVASAFARYPYPDSFFAWTAGTGPEGVVFFHRANRWPSWMPAGPGRNRFPVATATAPSAARALLEPFLDDARRRRDVSLVDVALGGKRYQVVAQLTYADPFRDELQEIVGFIVNLEWVREHYFAELTREVWAIGTGAENGLSLSVTDGEGQLVAGNAALADSSLTSRRTFALAFADPDHVASLRRDLLERPWTVTVSAATDPTLSRAISGANRTLVIGAVSTVALGLGLLLTARAQRSSARLTELRSDFVSTVTHELKTPIATIRAAAETLAQGRLQQTESLPDYARLVVRESKRLARLVDNLLAYARITDVADVYSFDRLEVSALLNDIQEEFEHQLDEAGFDVQISIESPDLAVRGDRVALGLLFDNLIDNAIRYSADDKRLQVVARASGDVVVIEVTDAGIGIDERDLPQVTRKFARGRNAKSAGSGLGLAIAGRIAADHGGRLDVHSALGQGTTVSVSLPKHA